MDILIKNMEMPKGCNECRFHDGSWCCAQPIKNWRDSYYRPPEGEKQPTCPLVEVPTHGRLGDLDKMYTETLESFSVWPEHCANDFACFIKDAPTVIEASK